MKKFFMLFIAAVMLVPISTQARHIKIYTFNGKGRPQAPPSNTPVAVASVTLSVADTTLAVGDTLTLKANVQPANATNKTVSWASSSPAVATVVNGKITALTAGATTITVTTQDGSKTATCNVVVNEVSPPSTAVTGVALNVTDTTLAVGDTLMLIADVQPDNATNKNVAWASSSPTTAAVNDGEVAALAEGTTTITVTTQDGSKTATCNVKVNEASAPSTAVIGVALNVIDTTLSVGETLTLMVTVLPANATNKAVTWTSSNTAIATVNSDGVVTPVSLGVDTITVTTEDKGKTAICVVTVEFGAVSLGTVSFVSNQTWQVSTLYGGTSKVWSDEVKVEGCNKISYNGGTINNPLADCRSNGSQGNLFSWKAVNDYKDLLCPNDWRVPTLQDFQSLNYVITSGNFSGSYISAKFRNSYLNDWGGYYGGYSGGGQGSSAYYWSLTESATNGYGDYLYFNASDARVVVGAMGGKLLGMTLRCVKD